MQTEKTTLVNRFHNTEVTIRPDSYRRAYGSDEVEFYLSASQVKRINRALCGMADCRCGTVDDPQVIHACLDASWNNGPKDWRKGYVIIYSPQR